MKFRTTSGKEMDTDKMGDIDAAIFEKLDEVNKFFIDLKIPYIIRLYNHQGKQTGTQSAIHPTDDHDKATGVLLSQCLAAVQKSKKYKNITKRCPNTISGVGL